MYRRVIPAARRAAGLLASLALLAWVVRNVAQGWEQIEWSATEIRPGALAASGALLLAAFLLRGGLYAHLLRRLDDRSSLVVAMRIYFASQAGRYLPGKLWQIAGAGVAGRLSGLSGQAAVLASTSIVVIHHVVGAVVGSFALLHFSRDVAWLAVGFVAAGVVTLGMLSSERTSRGIRWLGRAAGREIEDAVELPSRALLLRIAPVFVVIWALFGASLYFLCTGFPALAEFTAADATTAMAAACVAGYVVLIAPSGLGVREATLVVLLSPVFGSATAGVIALAMRLWMTAIEGVLIGWAFAGLAGRGPVR